MKKPTSNSIFLQKIDVFTQKYSVYEHTNELFQHIYFLFTRWNCYIQISYSNYI